MKTCSKCGKEQPETNFWKDGKSPSGLRYECKDCSHSYYVAHPEQISKSREKQYREEHREQISERKRLYWAAHKEQNDEHNKRYYAEHREFLLQQNKVWVAANKDAKQKADAVWRKNHPEVTRLYDQARRTRKAGLASTLTGEQWGYILNGFNNACAYCGVGDKTLTQDHFIPVSSEGEYGINNIIPACKSCNSSKGAKDFFTWYPKYDFYDKARERKILRYLNYSDRVQQLSIL